MKKKHLYITLIICLIIIIITLCILIPHYQKYKEKKELEERIKNATIIVDLTEDLTVPFLSEIKVSDFITNINGNIINDYFIDTSTLGEVKVTFKYINDEDIEIPYTYNIEVKDVTSPSIWLNDTYSITTDYEGSLLEDITCADDLDDNPTCEIIGEYNTNKEGKYQLTFKATDNSGNITEKAFTLSVKKPTDSPSKPTKYDPILFSDIVKEYKNSNTKIGIDVSFWQGDIDFDTVAASGVEFAFIRVGTARGIDTENVLDKKFIQNIEGFNRVGIPVGIYYYSYSNSTKRSIEDAKWVIEQIKDYQITLPIVYDWESWSFYNEFHQSFYSTTKNAQAFLDTIKKSGYNGALYSSKNYLEKVWFDTGYDVWLAHYTSQTSYQGPYTYWQLCSNGAVPGINGYVDIDIMYL